MPFPFLHIMIKYYQGKSRREIIDIDIRKSLSHFISALLRVVFVIGLIGLIFTSLHLDKRHISLNDSAKAADWYDADWGFRKKITIDHTKVDADLTDFPVLINYDEEGDLKAYAQADGDDILFTASDGITKLSHQIENYDSTDGSLRAWIKAPTLSSTTNTEFYIYYGNASATDQQNITDVWSNDYAGVWLMNEGEGTTVHDYSGNENHGTMMNMDPATDWIEHDNGYALDFDGGR